MSNAFEARVPTCVAALVLTLWSSTATAQPAAAPPPSTGPLIVERVRSGWLIAPDVKITEIADDTATLAGAYGGWITDNTFLIGGGGYWLTDGSDDREVAYGGLVLEWLARTDRRLGFGVRGLVGAGSATLGASFTDVGSLPRGFSRASRDSGRERNDQRVSDGSVRTVRLALRDDFFVAEPQVNLFLNLTDRLRLSVGAGYRLIGADDWAADRLAGATGSFSVQWGGGTSH